MTIVLNQLLFINFQMFVKEPFIKISILLFLMYFHKIRIISKQHLMQIKL